MVARTGKPMHRSVRSPQDGAVHDDTMSAGTSGHGDDPAPAGHHTENVSAENRPKHVWIRLTVSGLGGVVALSGAAFMLASIVRGDPGSFVTGFVVGITGMSLATGGVAWMTPAGFTGPWRSLWWGGTVHTGGSDAGGDGGGGAWVGGFGGGDGGGGGGGGGGEGGGS